MPGAAWVCGGGDPARLLEEAVAAEAAGFEAVVAFDRPSTTGVGVWRWLAAVALRTTRLGLVGVTAPLVRTHPVPVAEAATRLAASGRFVLGVWTGDAGEDETSGLPAVPNWERMGRLQEALVVLPRLLAGEHVAHDRPHLRVSWRLAPPPFQPPPIWMLADGPSSAGMAGRLAQGLIVEAASPEAAAADVVEPFRRSARAAAPVLALLPEAFPADAARRAVDLLDPALVGVRGPIGDAVELLPSLERAV